MRLLAHARRYLSDEFGRTKSPIAEEGLRQIQAFYAIEAKINGLPPERRHAERLGLLTAQHVDRVVDAIMRSVLISAPQVVIHRAAWRQILQ